MNTAPYPNVLSAKECRAVYRALGLLEKVLTERPIEFNSPQAVRDYLRLNLALEEREVFMCLWLDSQNKLIEAERVSLGTLGQTLVYTREVVKAALRHNAASVILAHNHPSGVVEPSEADISLTQNMRRVLAMVDVRVLDHLIVGGAKAPLSMAEEGFSPWGSRLAGGTATEQTKEAPAKRQRKGGAK